MILDIFLYSAAICNERITFFSISFDCYVLVELLMA